MIVQIDDGGIAWVSPIDSGQRRRPCHCCHKCKGKAARYSDCRLPGVTERRELDPALPVFVQPRASGRTYHREATAMR